MPTRSQSQRKLIFAKRSQYGSRAETPEKWKWVWEKDWENKGKLPDKVGEIKELIRKLVTKHLVKEGYIRVPDGYEDKIKSIADLLRVRSDFYNANGVNQLMIDLSYTIKQTLGDYIYNTDNLSKAGFEKSFSRELDSILYKYTTGKFQLFDSPNKNKIKKLIIKMVSDEFNVEKMDMRDPSIPRKIKNVSIEIVNKLLK